MATSSMKNRQRSIGIVTFPISEAGTIPLSNLIDILYSLSKDLYLITGNSGYTFFRDDKRLNIHRIRHGRHTSVCTRIVNYVFTQSRISCKLMKLSTSVDLWIFFIGGEGLVIPVLTAKLLRKKVLLVSAGSGVRVAQAERDPFTKVLAALQSITLNLVDRIIVYSQRIVEENDLGKYRYKISIARKHFLDFNKFKVHKQLDERASLVGYIGAVSKAKGIPNLLKAIPMVLNEKMDIQFLLGGAGDMEEELKTFLEEQNLERGAVFVGWIPHTNIPKYLNEFKLLVLPSYSEGLPNIMLEAMACGTPVLATPVGAILDVLRDEQTGFIMEDNSPESIARNVIRALNYPKLGEVAENARNIVGREYTHEAAVDRYRKILDS